MDRKDAGQEGCRTGDIQDRIDTRQEICRTGDMQDMKDAGQERYRTEAMYDRRTHITKRENKTKPDLPSRTQYTCTIYLALFSH